MNAQSKRNLLVVDDDHGVRRIICRYLERSGYTVLESASGAAAIPIVGALGATLAGVVLDMTMPGMDGEQTFEALHALQPDLPFLIYTGGCDNATLNRLMQTGWCMHLIKPCPMQLLLQTLEQLLARHPRAAPWPA